MRRRSRSRPPPRNSLGRRPPIFPLIVRASSGFGLRGKGRRLRRSPGTRPRTGPTQGAEHSLRSYSRQGRFRRPGIASSQFRIRKYLLRRWIVLRASRAGLNGPKYFAPFPSDLPAEIDAGKAVPDGQLEIGEALVVLEPQIEFRLMLLDEVVLEEGGLALRAGQNVIDVGRFGQDVADLEVVRRLEIRPDAVPEEARFADVNDLAGGVLEKIDAGLLGKGGDFRSISSIVDLTGHDRDTHRGTQRGESSEHSPDCSLSLIPIPARTSSAWRSRRGAWPPSRIPRLSTLPSSAFSSC